MEIAIPVSPRLVLRIADRPKQQKNYATSRLQKGLLLICDGQELAEEAVGFGLPVLKRGLQAGFPGELELDLRHRDKTWVVTAIYTIDLVEKIARSGRASVENRLVYTVKNFLAACIRRFPGAREFLTSVSSGLRRLFGWETTYEKAGFSTQARMTYTFDERKGTLEVAAEFAAPPGEGVTELIVMNEQGAHFFDRYRDSSGALLTGKEIGCWDEVAAETAGFSGSGHRVAFSLNQVAGARLFRGRELIGSRLAWSGFGYSFPPATRRFVYTVKIEETP